MSKEKSTNHFVMTFRNSRRPLFVLFVGILLTFVGTYHYHQIIESQANHDYLIDCNEIKVEILTGMHSQAQIIRVASAFIESSDTITRAEWKTFYQQSLVDKELPGIRSFGYAVVISNDQQKKNIQAIRKDGCPANTIQSLEERNFQTSCIFIEPFIGSNMRFLGYDMYAKPIRRKAMEMARDSDMVALSGKVILEHENAPVKEVSTLMYVPVFRNGSLTNTVEQRRKAIKGWVFSAYHMDDLMQGILEGVDSIAHNKIHLQIFDDSISGQSLLYDSQVKDKIASTNDLVRFNSIPVLIGGRKWILNFNRYDEQALHFQGLELIRLIGLLTINFLLFFLLLSLQNTSSRAQKIAEQLTKKLSITNKELARQNEELKRSEEALRNSNVFNETLLKTIPFGMDIVDDTGTVLFQSGNFKEIFGENAIGGKCWDLYRDDKKQCSDCPLTKNITVGKTETSESHGILGHRIFEINHTGMIYQGKKAVFEIFQDITERKQAEEKIIVLSKGIEQSSSSILITDGNGTIEFVNPKYCQLTGYSREEVIGQNPNIAQSGLTPNETYEKLWDTILAGKEWRGELLNKKKNGDLYWEYMSISQIKNAKGEITNFIAVKDDITDRKKAEEELRDVSARLALATRTGGVGVWEYDLANNSLLWDDQMFALYGIRKGDFSSIYQAWRAGLHPDDIDRGDREIQMAIRGEKEFDTEFRVVWPDGSIHTIKALASVQLDEAGRSVRMIGTNWDISEQKRTELEIKLQNEELQKINSEKDKFFSIIAHDLRGPLGNFMGMTEMLTDESYNFPESERKKIIEGLSRSARNTFSLLVNLLEWSQMDRGLTDFKPQKLDLTQTISECTSILEDSAKLKRIELIVQITNEPVVFADKNMLQTVIRNLISNAIKFTPKGGKVSVSAQSSADNMALISVRDTGIGMTKEMLDNLFRIDASTKRPGTSGELSTGLGLLLCKEFVEKLNGTIAVESEPNIGTVFSFNIPASIQEEKELAKPMAVSEEIHEVEIENLNILIAEDDEISMKLISVIVAGFSNQIYKVKTGNEAVKVSRENQDIDLILMDIAMPNMNGYEATRQIREYNKDVVIIAQTTYSLATDREKALQAGFNDNITKPFSKAEIIAMLKKHIKPSI